VTRQREPVSALSRRAVLGLGVGVALAATGCSSNQPTAGSPATTTPRPTAPQPAATTTTASSIPPPGGPAIEVVRGDGSKPQVALTFHGAGEPSIAKQIHDILGVASAKATIMAVGTWLTASPDAITMFHDSGHEVGNHTWSHGVMAEMGATATLTEIERCRDKLAELVGTPGAFFRQSDARHPTQRELVEAGQAGYARVLSYDIDGLDWRDPGPVAIRAAVATATAGSVVSLHLGHSGTVSALPNILRDLAARGLSPVTATELLTES
jgi:peptidoglycan/xylan/chitin deacetylase (PgdA/CDA1 family)